MRGRAKKYSSDTPSRHAITSSFFLNVRWSKKTLPTRYHVIVFLGSVRYASILDAKRSSRNPDSSSILFPCLWTAKRGTRRAANYNVHYRYNISNMGMSNGTHLGANFGLERDSNGGHCLYVIVVPQRNKTTKLPQRNKTTKFPGRN